ncbi:hypothetical protein B0H12DRAFT_1116494 [Mycena haematopus]|nr:hypothetical protein B0H12DRAFT_1116494 [Mycena haematopus]
MQTEIQQQSPKFYYPSTAICQIFVNYPVWISGSISAVVWRFFCFHPAEIGGFGPL